MGYTRIWETDRIEVADDKPKFVRNPKIERLSASTLSAFGYAAYFSMLSAFAFGFRDFNVGTWIAHVQAREYTLKPVGWVRAVSGLQSLLSFYLLAVWALTNFGRPFQ